MEKYKKKTVNRLVHDIDDYAYEAEHLETCEYAIDIGVILETLLTRNDAIEMMGVMQKQIAARNRLAEELGKIARREA